MSGHDYLIVNINLDLMFRDNSILFDRFIIVWILVGHFLDIWYLNHLAAPRDGAIWVMGV